MVESPFVMSSPSGAIVAFLIKNLILLWRSPPFPDGTFPDVRWLRAARQLSLRSCAAFHAALLKKEASGCKGAHLVAGSITVSDKSFMNL